MRLNAGLMPTVATVEKESQALADPNLVCGETLKGWEQLSVDHNVFVL